LAYVIPDTQSRDLVRNPLIPIARHICHLRPSMLIHLGDHWDFPSLSPYDKGKKSHQALTYHTDVVAGNNAMIEFWHRIMLYWPSFHNDCESVILGGNHENRRIRAMDIAESSLVELMTLFPPNYDHWDTQLEFLKVFKWEGIEFCHYFQNPASARPINTARMLLTKRHISCIAGHKQGWDYEELPKGCDSQIQAIIAGSCYYHDETYKAHTNNHFRGTFILKNVKDGTFDYSRYSLESLTNEYK